MGLETANTNKRQVEFFGDSIHKTSLFSGSYHYDDSLKFTTLTVSFDAVGSKNKGTIYFEWGKKEKNWIISQIIFTDSDRVIHPIIDTLTLTDSFESTEAYTKTKLDAILTKMIEEKDGFVILTKSKEKNDYIQTCIEVTDQGGYTFEVNFSDGYTKWNKKAYQAKYPINNKDEIIQIFDRYAKGTDEHMNLIEWNRLTSIEPKENNVGFFKFEEPATDFQ